ncbi:peptidylprolyl isomerase [Cognatishimia sp. WU-CL00825]|uniref:peptidylprolyl isomerase n=1 Tax=Cognatishimia sp. WU-CL00825 TaxID=3127658 RepID=UPI00310977B5
MTLKTFLSGAITAGILLASASSLSAQSLFSPAATVNNKVVTWYEVDQRAKFYKAIRRFGDLQKIARNELIEERLKSSAAESLGIEVTPEGLRAGLEEFAKRANLTPEQFIKAAAQEGVDAETFQEFVRNGLLWREVVAARFRGRIQISDAEIDAALGSAGQAGLRVLLSEVIIPVTPETEAQVLDVANQISEVKSYAAFAQAAAQFSAARTKENGGRLDWLPLNRLPGPIQAVVLELKPGEVTPPLELERAVAVFQMRDVQELPTPAVQYAAIEYGVFKIPGGNSPEAHAAALAYQADLDTCDDLYGANFGGPEEALQIDSRLPSEIPRDIALELAKLDRHEISTNLTSADGQHLLLIMMCGRTAAVNEEASRENVLNALRNRRLASYADGYLEQLRAEAVIEIK